MSLWIRLLVALSALTKIFVVRPCAGSCIMEGGAKLVMGGAKLPNLAEAARDGGKFAEWEGNPEKGNSLGDIVSCGESANLLRWWRRYLSKSTLLLSLKKTSIVR